MSVFNCLSFRRRRFIITTALSMICVACGLVGTDAITSNRIRSCGLDYWNYIEESGQLDAQTEKGRQLDCKREAMRQDRERINNIASSLCRGDITFDDAIESIHILLENSSSSYKVADLKTSYICVRYLRPEASERDTYACFLLVTIKGMQLTSEILGDESSAAFFSDRLIHIYQEAKAQSQGLLPTIVDPQ